MFFLKRLLYHFGKWAMKHKKVLALISSVVLVACFFIPVASLSYIETISYTTKTTYYFPYQTILSYNNCMTAENYYQFQSDYNVLAISCLIAFILFVLCAVFFIYFLFKIKNYFIALIPLIFYIGTDIFTLTILNTTANGMILSYGFYILLAIFLFQLFSAIAHTYYSKHGAPIPKPPKPKKLTQKERIAELERQVAELAANKKDRSN